MKEYSALYLFDTKITINNERKQVSLTNPRDSNRAARIFEHARRQSKGDYAMELFLDGLWYDPENVGAHKELRALALRRKSRGGEPAEFSEKFGGGRTPLEKFIHTEALWSKDPLNGELLLDVMRHAVKVYETEKQLNFADVVYWVGSLFLKNHQILTKLEFHDFLNVRDLFVKIGAYGPAADACRQALAHKPNDDRLRTDLRNLEAEHMVCNDRWGDQKIIDPQPKSEDGESRPKDAPKPFDVIDTDPARLQLDQHREQYEKNPEDVDVILKLVNELISRNIKEDEVEAIEILEKGFAATQQYRLKMKIGDIRIRQMNREQAELKQVADKDAEDSHAKDQWRKAQRQQLEFELTEYRERIRNYPTDSGLKFELGRRLFVSQQYSKAIEMFQQVKSNLRYRSVALEYLGRCYEAEHWLEEAVDAYRSGIEAHPANQDRLGMKLQYRLMGALRAIAERHKDLKKAREALQIASKILQADINYLDIREQMQSLHSLIEQLKEQA